MVEEIRQLIEYNGWANRTMIEALEQLSPDELQRELGGSFPSILHTLVHLMGAEWVWLMRWRGISPEAIPTEWGGTALEQVRTAWETMYQEQLTFVADLTEARLHQDIEYRNLAGQAFTSPLWQLLRHVVNHSTYHRGQIATLTRQIGRTPANTDLIRFFRQGGSPGTVPA